MNCGIGVVPFVAAKLLYVGQDEQKAAEKNQQEEQEKPLRRGRLILRRTDIFHGETIGCQRQQRKSGIWVRKENESETEL
jgi:hypothetical protein